MAGFSKDAGARLTAGVEGVFTPEIWTSQLLQDLEQHSILSSPLITNRTYEGEFRKGGDTIRVPHFIDTVEDKGVVKAYGEIGEADHAELDYIRMTVQKGSSFHLEIDSLDQLFTQAGIDKMTSLVRQRGRRAARSLDMVVADTITHAMNGKDANSAPAGALPAAMVDLPSKVEKLERKPTDSAYDMILEAIMQLDYIEAPEDRYLVISPGVRKEFLKDPMFINASFYGGQPVIPTGHIGQILNIPIYVSNQLGTVKTPNKPMVEPAIDNLRNIDMLLGATNAVSVVIPHAEMATYKPEKKFTDAIKSRIHYDAKIVRPEQLIAIGPKNPS
ncbi:MULTISPECIES: phage major capsid protein [unclassified Streptomyces]|uniref:phage major capsid protein n=1 Tax=unclassified Streptomyces TaxID=2593676 RepID=UPI0022AFA560|nr:MULTISPECIES: hypothetical protein [unclassified Streptomyces]MCZ4097317.1 hypothetical protein [Streptomyces sp. H39-C1]MCZ4120621.1 hypothetical protein [Streptomyces sp. H39-S7]